MKEEEEPLPLESDFTKKVLNSLRALTVAHDNGLLTLQQIQAFETNFAKELHQKAKDATGLKGINEQAMNKVRELLGIRLNPPPLRLIPQDDNRRMWTIQESEGQVHTFLNVGDIYDIEFKESGEKLRAEFKNTSDST